ncbi:hypothetical protein LIA77_00195 [Sarocladium implicatum]|nr:hypothetical protein LIA77_00195 [Sarocladium implicatum]
MAPITDHRPRRVVRLARENNNTPIWPWTVGDETDGEDEVRTALKKKRRVRRQEPNPTTPSPGDGSPVELVPDNGPDDSLSASQTDGISSESSAEEGDGDVNDDRPTQTDGRPTRTGGVFIDEPTVVTMTSTRTVSQSFTTLIPGGGRVQASEFVESVSRTITSLTPIMTIVDPETTWTVSAPYTTVEEQLTTVTSWRTHSTSSVASQAAQTSAVADADSSPTPRIIRVHDHPHNLSKDAIHGLIAFGALGGFMGFLAVAWFFWRRHRKLDKGTTSKRSQEEEFARPSRGVRILARIPFLKDRFGNRSWFNIDDPYYQDNNNSRTSVFMEKSATFTSTSKPRLDSQFFAPNQPMGVAVRIQGGDNPPSVEQNVSSGLGHHVGASISSTNPQRSDTVRSRQAPFPITSQRRTSEISSLSSGFGDGDLIVPNGESTMERLPQPPPTAKFSDAASRRDTVYTEASEDQPPRFRNVNSWVRQQTGRVKRSQARTQAEDAPPVPQMPAEEDYALMLPDGEEPRRPQNEMGGNAR